MTSPLVTAQWLQQHLHDPNLVILDSSIEFQIPAESEKDWVNKIPNAQRFDYDKVFCDPDSPLPHMMPSEERFNTLARELGINQDSFIVVYDNSGTFASPRAWWMFKAMGHHKVYILNGGLTEWKVQGYNVTQNYRELTAKGNFDGKHNPKAFVDASYVLKQIDNPHSQTIDARGLARFFGEVPEPRPGVRSGHIPGSACLPFAELIAGHKLKEETELRPLLTHMLPDTTQEYLFSCGSGVTACIVLLAAYVCGYQNLSVYDGSWTEWGQRQDLPIE
ncbi:3-mercaptopyruvate sulfurtransferase [Vibrio cholerae]|uniref:3-mercaptopyruvate sulfurtransferase n=1 Tax=Vibrio cholerae TaxID=666 RepID=UPI00084AB5A7|nr:3-mercaptopyruvate sulfurtransferase [Vibrio cholerae]EJL6415980.1 3-mercaptopyruvate sulfurtransferase [Vibrio cholerae]EJL6451780.1 3-mercaptopyruvate sulfurtransferase [Vibrio cholerae]NOF77315.1 3-mercaptopyruvate sulfurtransferase [Vibrio cholerae]NOF81889.1 3-mercaptopyruvate sulfurtransferase [Vibrio cholerae]OEC31052.1 thiosulfate sulfurtransferase [Vibrio cholerae]